MIRGAKVTGGSLATSRVVGWHNRSS